MDFVTKDSGQRQEFDTGSRRDTREGKGRYDLLPYFGLRRLARLYERGAEKYGDRNWEKGQPLSRYIDSGLRHAMQAAAGYTDEDHLAAVVWNFLAIIDHQERIKRGQLPRELDDLPVPSFETPDDLPVAEQLVLPLPEPQAAPPTLAPTYPSPWTRLVYPYVTYSTAGGDVDIHMRHVNSGHERPYGPNDDQTDGHNHD